MGPVWQERIPEAPERRVGAAKKLLKPDRLRDDG
jgi:hypothetical protein